MLFAHILRHSRTTTSENSFKGTVSRDFFVHVFSSKSAPSGPIRNVLGQIWFFSPFHQIIGLLKQLPGFQSTGESQLPSFLSRYLTGESFYFFCDTEEFLWNKKISADHIVWAINLKFLQIVDNYMAYTLLKFNIDSLQIVISTNFFILQNYFRILDRLGLNFLYNQSNIFTECRQL